MKKIFIDFKRRMVSDNIIAIQGDNENEVYRFIFLDGLKRKNIEGKTVRMSFKRKSSEEPGKLFDLNVVSAKDGEAELVVSNEITIGDGLFDCQIALFGKDGFLENSISFIANIKKNILVDIANDIVPTTAFETLTNTLQKVENWNDYFDEVTPELEKKYTTELNKKRESTEILPINVSEMDAETRKLFTGGSVAVLGENSVGRENYKANSIDETKLTFVQLGKNKFTGEYKQGYVLTGDVNSGFIFGRDDASSAGGCCAICKVEPNKTYTISKDGGNRFRVALFADYPQERSRSTGGKEADSSSSITISTGTSDNYAVIYTSYPSITPPTWLQVEEGSSATEYEPSKPVIDLATDSLSPETIKNNLVLGMIVGNPSSFVVDFSKKNIAISSGGLFIMNGTTYYSPSAAQTLSFGNFRYQTVLIIFNLKTKQFELVDIDQFKAKRDICLVGTIRREKEEVFILGLGLVQKDDAETTSSEILSYPLCFDFENYKSSNETFIENSTVDNIEKIYAEYDKLVAKYPDYITKTLLGAEETGLEIYCYDFNPKLPVSSPQNGELPLLLYTNSIHGHEVNNQGEALRFFIDLCDNWDKNKALAILRWNLRIKFVPVQNPWGLNNKSRNNSRGVDLNRNFEWNFQQTGDHGASALSEKESQIINQFMKENSNALFGIDHHNFDRLTTHTFYISMFPKIYDRTYKGFVSCCNYLNYNLKENYSNFFEKNNTNFTRIEREYVGGVQHTQFDLNGIPGTLLETVPSIDTANPTSPESKDATQKFLSEVVGNLMLNILKNNNYIYKAKSELKNK